MAASAELDEVDRQVFLTSLDVNEEEFFRLLRWSVLPEEGFGVSDIEWLERCLEDKDVPTPSTPVRPFLDACLEKGVVEPVDYFPNGDEAKPEKRRYQLEVPWHRLVGESSRLVLKAALEAFIHRTIEKLRLITIDFSRKDFYLKSCSDYERFSRLIFHALALMLLPNRQHAMEDEFWQGIFRDTFFGRINESGIIGAFWYLQDRMEEEDRGLFLSIRDAMLERVQWAEHPLLLSIMIKLEMVLRFSKCSKKFGNVEERKPLLAEVENEFRMALTEFNLTQDYPCIMGYYFDVMLDIVEKAPIVDGTPRDKAWKTELRKLCAKSQEYWNLARVRLQGSEEQCHAIIHHIHAISKEAHLQLMSGEMNESDVKHEMVLKEAEKRYGDHKITATFASFYGDYYLKRGERRSNFGNKEDDYRRAMQFFMKEFRILQHCDARDQSRLKINLGKQGYVKALMGHGKEALVDAKKAFLMGEDLRDWRTEGSGFLRYNYLNVIFLHWMGLEDRKGMGTKWWMARELKAFLLPEQQLSSLRESGAVLIPAGAGTKPNTHEELIHNLMIAVYRVQARPRLLSPRIHPAQHLFWSNVVEEYVVSEEDQIIALEAVRVYMETGGVIVLRKRPPPPVEKENAEARPAAAVPASLTTALRSIDLNNNVVVAEVPSPSVTKVAEDVAGAEKMVMPAATEPDVASTEDLSEEAKKLVDAAQLLREAGIVNTTAFGKWRALRGIDK